MAKRRSSGDELNFTNTTDKTAETLETLNSLDKIEDVEVIPAKTDPGWHDYVMKLFLPNELQDSYPKVDGLRRVVRLLIGEIVVHEVKPFYANRNEACVVVRVVVHGKDGTTYEYSEVSDVHSGNTDSEFVRHASATAATKAEGRVYRKLLNIRTIAYEEKSTAVLNLVGDEQLPDKINAQQINVLRIICSRNNLSLKKFANAGADVYKNLNDIPFDTAQKMIQYLSDAVHQKKFKEEWLNTGEEETWNN